MTDGSRCLHAIISFNCSHDIKLDAIYTFIEKHPFIFFFRYESKIKLQYRAGCLCFVYNISCCIWRQCNEIASLLLSFSTTFKYMLQFLYTILISKVAREIKIS